MKLARIINRKVTQKVRLDVIAVSRAELPDVVGEDKPGVLVVRGVGLGSDHFPEKAHVVGTVKF